MATGEPMNLKLINCVNIIFSIKYGVFSFFYLFTERWEGNVNSFRYFAAFMKVMNTGNHLHTFPLPPKNISTWMNRIKVGRMYTKTILVKQWKDPFAVTNHLTILFTHLLTYVRSTKCILLHTSLLMSESRYLLKGFLSMASRLSWLINGWCHRN